MRRSLRKNGQRPEQLWRMLQGLRREPGLLEQPMHVQLPERHPELSERLREPQDRSAQLRGVQHDVQYGCARSPGMRERDLRLGL